MRFPAKANAVLFSGFLGGALLAGVGGGVAFAEYLSFDYDDTALAISDASETKEFAFDLAKDEVVNFNIPRITKMTEDESIAQGSLVIEATYNPNFLEPYFYAENSLCYVDERGEFHTYDDGEYYHYEDYDAGVSSERSGSRAQSGYAQAIPVKTIRMDYADYVSDFDIFMLNKDAILESFKNRTFTSFESDRDIEITVRVNPADAERFNNENGSFRNI